MINSENDRNRIIRDLNIEIMSWKGVDTRYCAKNKKSFKEYKITSRNWFNRNKGKLCENYLVYPVVFIDILQVYL